MSIPVWCLLLAGGVAWAAAVIVAAWFMRAAALPTPRPGAGLRTPGGDDA